MTMLRDQRSIRMHIGLLALQFYADQFDHNLPPAFDADAALARANDLEIDNPDAFDAFCQIATAYFFATL
jgi:hypothetical protein